VAASGLRLEADLGLSSLDVAEIVADLDARLSSPAHDRLPIADLRTVGDLCLACRCRLLGEPPSSTEPDALLAASRRRGEARRRRSVR
jgi:hypothetical protein